MNYFLRISALGVHVLLLSACMTGKNTPSTTNKTYPIPTAVIEGQMVNTGHNVQYTSAAYSSIPDWQQQNFPASLKSFKNSCQKLYTDPDWASICQKAAQISDHNKSGAKYFFENEFTPWTIKYKGNLAGVVTGYYEPAIQGSLQSNTLAKFPIYGIPDDFVSVDLPKQYLTQKGIVRIQATGKNRGIISSSGPYTANLSQFHITSRSRALKGRFLNNQFIPYHTRAEINAGALNGKAPILAYANDPVELFFLQVQGSGRMMMDNGHSIRLAFADKNEHPYQSIAQYMANQGYLPLRQTNMQGIKQWIQQNPHKMAEVLGRNPSYVFFRSLPNNHDDGPSGALGVPLTGGYSAAVDRHFIKLGSPVFVATTDPRNQKALNRLLMAQDTGSAITGGVRIDYFWGYGDEAGQIAGKMKHTGYVWVLLPNHIKPRYFP